MGLILLLGVRKWLLVVRGNWDRGQKAPGGQCEGNGKMKAIMIILEYPSSHVSIMRFRDLFWHLLKSRGVLISAGLVSLL